MKSSRSPFPHPVNQYVLKATTTLRWPLSVSHSPPQAARWSAPRETLILICNSPSLPRPLRVLLRAVLRKHHSRRAVRDLDNMKRRNRCDIGTHMFVFWRCKPCRVGIKWQAETLIPPGTCARFGRLLAMEPVVKRPVRVRHCAVCGVSAIDKRGC